MYQTIYPAIQAQVAAWEGVRAEAQRFGGVEFKMGRVEIGHVHRSGMTDVPFTRRIRQALVAAGAAEPHHLLADSGWVSFYIRQASDAAQAIALLRLSYLHKRRQRTRADYSAAIAALPFPTEMLPAAFGTADADDTD